MKQTLQKQSARKKLKVDALVITVWDAYPSVREVGRARQFTAFLPSLGIPRQYPELPEPSAV